MRSRSASSNVYPTPTRYAAGKRPAGRQCGVRAGVLLVLAVFVVIDAAGIGLLLARQGPKSPEQAVAACRREVPSNSPQDQGACIRRMTSARDVPATHLVLLVPLFLGAIG